MSENEAHDNGIKLSLKIEEVYECDQWLTELENKMDELEKTDESKNKMDETENSKQIFSHQHPQPKDNEERNESTEPSKLAVMRAPNSISDGVLRARSDSPASIGIPDGNHQARSDLSASNNQVEHLPSDEQYQNNRISTGQAKAADHGQDRRVVREELNNFLSERNCEQQDHVTSIVPPVPASETMQAMDHPDEAQRKRIVERQ